MKTLVAALILMFAVSAHAGFSKHDCEGEGVVDKVKSYVDTNLNVVKMVTSVSVSSLLDMKAGDVINMGLHFFCVHYEADDKPEVE